MSEYLKSLKQEIIGEMDEYGLIDSASDNPILFTIQFYNVCKKLGMFDAKDAGRLTRSIWKLWRRTKFEIIFGLLNRYPDKNDRKDQHDNYTAVSSVISLGLFQGDYAKLIDDYGKDNWYCYNNIEPGKFSFDCLRQGFDVFFYKVCAGDSPFHWFGINYLWFAGKIYFEFKGKKGKDLGETSSHMLSWLRFLAIGDFKYMKWLKKYWVRKMEKKYGKLWLYEIFNTYHPESSTTIMVYSIPPEDYL